MAVGADHYFDASAHVVGSWQVRGSHRWHRSRSRSRAARAPFGRCSGASRAPPAWSRAPSMPLFLPLLVSRGLVPVLVVLRICFFICFLCAVAIWLPIPGHPQDRCGLRKASGHRPSAHRHLASRHVMQHRLPSSLRLAWSVCAQSPPSATLGRVMTRASPPRRRTSAPCCRMSLGAATPACWAPVGGARSRSAGCRARGSGSGLGDACHPRAKAYKVQRSAL